MIIAPQQKRTNQIVIDVRSMPGFDPDFVEGPADPNIICPICQFIIEDAVCCPQGHIFCRSCVVVHLQQFGNGNCPLDRSELSLEDIRPVLMVNSLVGQLPSLCCEECPWRGRLDLRQGHTETCQEKPVPCRNVGCQTLVQRKNLADHMEACLFAGRRCTECNSVQQLQHMEEHRRLGCPRAQRYCPLGCGQRMQRMNVFRHVSLDCLLRAAFCQVPGCNFHGTGMQLAQHNANDASLHNQLLWNAICNNVSHTVNQFI
ncbi:TNF receptor-associated factor 4-like [Nematostella vectensis]|uniref:TNF receptor-associated factor 4 n=1 Tax=Nematostella vectensis TaxID=45351 RepID=UPI0013903457|nr:TNF receptor-associated factor 4 [Nematostella vectensis]XP_048589013.1 TNF receptor-associated factor 4-like [Nematostella vectensis]